VTGDEIRAYCKRRRYPVKYTDYWVAHPWCEAYRAAGVAVAAGAPHHIATRGAHGECNEPWNLISLAPANHRMVHQGEARFLETFPTLRPRFKRAHRDIWGWQRKEDEILNKAY